MRTGLIFATLLMFATGCAPLSKGVAALDVSARDMGVASWYGEDFHGRLAANGERFNMYALSAAHRTLPLGSIVRVLNVHTGRHLYLPITDRGPYIQGRMLDLSYAAAQQLGMSEDGLAPVYLEVSEPSRMLHNGPHSLSFTASRPAENRSSLEPESPAYPWSPADLPNRRSRRSRLHAELEERETAIVGASSFEPSEDDADA